MFLFLMLLIFIIFLNMSIFLLLSLFLLSFVDSVWYGSLAWEWLSRLEKDFSRLFAVYYMFYFFEFVFILFVKNKESLEFDFFNADKLSCIIEELIGL